MTDSPTTAPVPGAGGVKLAAVDIGTNAVRLLLSRVLENGGEPQVKKESLVRIPIRLGEDVFGTGRISEEKRRGLLQTMQAFKYLMEAYGSVDYLACATAAMREAENGPEIAEQVRSEAGIDLEVIDGRREAEIICLNRPIQGTDKERPFLYLDVGGGSTEVAIFWDNRVVDSRSFKIGGVRILTNHVDKEQWKELKKWVKNNTEPFQPMTVVGSGGNINKAFRLARGKEGVAITFKKLDSIFKELCRHSYDELMQIYQMRPDRADVIVPALDIYLSVMKWAKAKEIVVPLQGLSDGLVHQLYEKYRTGNNGASAT